MIRRIQDKLRDDPELVAAAARARRGLAPGQRALLVWDGDWVLNRGVAGRGLAGLRQAIAVEIAFSSPACRRQSQRGIVLIRLSDAPDAPQLALGAASWRWSELALAR